MKNVFQESVPMSHHLPIHVAQKIAADMACVLQATVFVTRLGRVLNATWIVDLHINGMQQIGLFVPTIAVKRVSTKRRSEHRVMEAV